MIAALVAANATLEAHVTRIEILKVEPVPAAQTNGQAVPPYERISGRFYGELDPRDPSPLARCGYQRYESL